MDICQTSSQGADEKCVLEGAVEWKLCSSGGGENMFKGLKGNVFKGLKGNVFKWWRGKYVQRVEGECVQGVKGECVQGVEGNLCSRG